MSLSDFAILTIKALKITISTKLYRPQTLVPQMQTSNDWSSKWPWLRVDLYKMHEMHDVLVALT